VRRHVIGTLGSVPIARVIFRRETLEKISQVQDYVGIGVFLNDQ
jgi:hypothetical protein